MRWLSFRHNQTDERIVNTRNMIYKEMYRVVTLLCLASIIVKYTIYGPNTGMIATELVILLLSALYYGVRSVILGLYSDEVEVHDRTSRVSLNAKNWVLGLGLGIAIAAFFGIRSAIIYGHGGMQSVWYFVIVFFAALMMYVPLLVVVLAGSHALANKVSKKAAQEKLDE
jgi:hypothetical protein